MNIALFLDCYLPMKNGVLTSVLNLKEGLEKSGHRAVVVGVQVKGYRNGDKNVLLCPLVSFDFGTKQGYGLGLVNRKNLYGFLRKNKVEIIHTHTEYAIGLAGKFAAKKLGLPRVSTFHTMWEEYSNYSPLLKIKPLIRNYLKYYYTGTSVITAPSIKAKKYSDLINPEIPKVVIPNAIDLHKFKAEPIGKEELAALRKKHGIQAGDKIIVFLGRIGPEKRVEALFDTLAPVLKKNSGFKLLFIGDGPALEDLKRQAAKLGIGNQVIFTGFVEWEKVHKYFALADLFASASLSEVHPMTFIEALMSGLPIVARKDDSYLDLVESGQNGYLTDTDREIGRKSEEILKSEKILAEFSAKSLEISQRFSIENHVNKMTALYEQVLENRNGITPTGITAIKQQLTNAKLK